MRIALSGGETPKPMYELLAQDPVRRRLPWDRVQWILGDERFVPPSSPDSNYGMARAAFLAHVPVPEHNVHPVPTEGVDLKEAAAQYEATLKSLYGGSTLRIDRPLLDLTLLGLGPDGHTASLLPGPAGPEGDETLGGAGAARPPAAAHQPHLSGARTRAASSPSSSRARRSATFSTASCRETRACRRDASARSAT